MQAVTRRMWVAAQLVIVTLVASPSLSYAQSSASGSLGITATVVIPLELAVSRPLDFGRMLTATTKTIAPTAATSGRFMLAGQNGSAVTVTLSMPSQLNPSVGTSMPITGWTYVVSSSSSLGGTPVAFNSGTSDPINVVFDAANRLYFGIGATVTASASQSTVAYNGSGQITAAYTDL